MKKIDKKYLPSRNFIKALLIALGVVLIATIINYWRASSTTYQNDSLVADITATSSWLNNNIDTDKDSLPDWQEVLYGTDPKKSDTDGDGTLDAQEIGLNRDPLKANTAKNGSGPNDKIDPNLVASDQKFIEEYQKLTDTEKIARDLMSNIIASQPTGAKIDQDTINSLVTKTIQEIPQKKYTGVTEESDLNFIKNTETVDINQALKIYVGSYYKETENLRKFFGEDIKIINSAIVGEYKIKNGSLDVVISKYQSIIDNLIAMPIPSKPGLAGATYHLAVINDLEKLIAIDNDIIKPGIDSVSMFGGLVAYNNAMNDLVFSLGVIDSVFQVQRK